MQSSGVVDALKNLPAFTLTGWINTRSSTAGSGGNRIISWINNGGEGVDLVYQSNGSLRLGVDGWPDFSPAFSSANKVSANAAAPASNWVFFAVTYHSNGQVQFYFGNNTTDATLDVTRSYPGRGLTGSNIGKLAIGAFNDATRNAATYDRMFRGLIDDIRIHNSVLTIQNIVAVQREIIDTTPPPAPTLLTAQSVTTSSVTLQWQVPPDQSDIAMYVITGNVGGAEFTASSSLTPFNIPGLNANTTYTFFVKSKDHAGNLSGPSNVVTVTTLGATPDTTPPTVPEGLVITGKTATTVSMEWLPSTDDVGVTQYNIHSGFGAPVIAQVQGTMTTLTNLIPATAYILLVSAVDAAGNVSGLGDPILVTTNATSGASIDPLLALEFNETSGTAVSYSGTAVGSFTRSASVPASSTIAPAGVGFGSL